MATRNELENQIKEYKDKILGLRNQAINCIKDGKPGPEYGKLILEEQFYGSLIMFNSERLKAFSSL